ncbi:MAG: biotin--[acetyl-CoA-carboxylase] ligase [Muribaculaceae bacterium]|nr:biotin--[acetyl-CoA-carboxylase] ligase [Muribaculaceae bacterium]
MSKITDIGEVTSTVSYMDAHKDDFGHGDIAITHNQTAGRGQRGNSWEAEPGKNLTFSFMMRDIMVPAHEQFAISEAVAVAIANVLRRYVEGVKIKWSNDIYAGDKKICGILIENSLLGSKIVYSTAGIGINVNQQLFTSPAPNPVSLLQLTGKEYSLEALIKEFSDELIARIEPLRTPQYRAYMRKLDVEYKEMLYRADGKFYPFALPDGTQFDAQITDVAPDGKLTLTLTDGTQRGFYFKEVVFII